MYVAAATIMICLLAALLLVTCCPGDVAPGSSPAQVTELPAPDTTGTMTLEQAIAQRRSKRSFTAESLTKAQIGQLLWAAQGITAPQQGLRAAPSAGALYPLELYVVTADGVYHYQPDGHSVRRHLAGDKRAALATACLGQRSVQQAAADFVFTAVFSRTRAKYGPRADRYVHNEVGAAAENLCLQATALGLGSVMVGAFDDGQVTQALNLPADHSPALVGAFDDGQVTQTLNLPADHSPALVIPVGYVP